MLGNVSDLDLRLIRVFIAIVDAGGLSAAQSTLNVGQSTLSSQLVTLETRLGFRLCRRGRAGFCLTAKGERFAQLARDLLAAVGEFSTQARHLDRKLVGTLHVGLIGHVSIDMNVRIAQAIARFRERDEAVQFNFFVRSPEELESQLLSGQLQLAVGYFWHRLAALQYMPLFAERQRAYCGRGHPLFDGTDEVMAEALEDYEWTWRSYPLPEASRLLPSSAITAVTDDMEAAAVLILSGRHLGYLPEHVAAPYLAAGLLSPVSAKMMQYDVQFHVATRKRESLDDVVAAFLEDLLQVPRVSKHDV
ncbi:LysR family transcriptional regulator [Dyella sp.]|uniref:LysR family transcriptional regulator n=1 Tax=Dyella sp. TaxID=1869338 RepID=UPI002B45D9A5|nr:LysR family transcriptional regulator [Dyella sp.]HKT30355.1 LysR family transcriptional regulator [Dyella sp.]